MIDIQIKNIEKLSVRERENVFNLNSIITEKIDGTKVNLITTGELDVFPFILSYKGFIIYPFESELVDELQMREKSIGPSQYKIIFDKLRYIRKNLGEKIIWSDMKPGTQLFFEFVQRKKTLTREYRSYGDLFLIGRGHCDYWTKNGRIFTIENEVTFEYENIKAFAIENGFQYLPRMVNPPATDFEPAVKFIKNKYMETSMLQGTPEGVVIETDGRFYKMINDGQYDKDIRRRVKDKYDADYETETKYWKDIYQLAQTFVEVTGIDRGFGFKQALKAIADICYETDCPVPHPKRYGIQKQDDLFLTCKNLLINEFNCQFGKLIGLYPLAGKPVHAGHWKMITNACKSNDHVILFVSEKDRKIDKFNILSGESMKRIWKDDLIPELPENCTVIFTSNPTTEVMHYMSFYSMFEDNLRKGFSIYSDTHDKMKFDSYTTQRTTQLINNVGVDRKTTVDISGTEMRKFLLQDKKQEFIEFLPNVEKREEIWKKLRKNIIVE